MLIQRVVRGRQARKIYKGLKRLILIHERDKELAELDLMREEDGYITFALFRNKSATDCQKTFRGWLARVRAFDLLVVKTVAEQTEYYNNLSWVRYRYESNKRSLKAKAKIKNKKAIEIQRTFRGWLGRIKAEERRLYVFKEGEVRKIQYAFRGHQARLQLQALRRAYVNEQRFRKVQKTRARILRFFRVKSRAKDRLGNRKGLMKYIEYLGVDPMGYNLYPTSLIQETWDDFRRIVQIGSRYVHLFVSICFYIVFSALSLPVLLYGECKHVMKKFKFVLFVLFVDFIFSFYQ